MVLKANDKTKKLVWVHVKDIFSHTQNLLFFSVKE